MRLDQCMEPGRVKPHLLACRFSHSNRAELMQKQSSGAPFRSAIHSLCPPRACLQAHTCPPPQGPHQAHCCSTSFATINSSSQRPIYCFKYKFLEFKVIPDNNINLSHLYSHMLSWKRGRGWTQQCARKASQARPHPWTCGLRECHLWWVPPGQKAWELPSRQQEVGLLILELHHIQ